MPSPVKLTDKPVTPFRKRTPAPLAGANVREIFNVLRYDGDIGLEVEVEGNKFPKDYDDYDDEGNVVPQNYIPDPWQYTHDGSLRGEDNAEYIFRRPVKFEEVSESIDKLWEMFDDFGSVLDDSNRTSVHVHLNAQEWHLNRVCAFFGLYIIVEDILTHWCGDHRVGNLFCLRAKDAPGIVSRMKQFFRSEHSWVIDNGMHYSGLNAHALKKLGSIEIRTMRGVRDPETIKTWVRILENIYKLSEKYPDPRTVVQGFSGSPREDFLRTILGDDMEQIVRECGMTPSEVSSSLLEGVRLAQQLCYCRNWSEYKPTEIKRDAFGRKPSPQPTATYSYGEADIAPAPMTSGSWSINAASDLWIGDN